MATLTETAYKTRKAINWTILAIFAYIILRISLNLLVSIWLYFFPPKLPPPNHAFGVLPRLQFPNPESSPSASLTFRLETIEGSIPTASKSATVYFMPKAAANLLALNETQEFAKRFGFDPNPVQETKNMYRFNDIDFLLRTLRYDIVSNNFVLRYGFEDDTGVFNKKNFLSSDALVSESKNILQTYNLYVDDVQEGTTQVTFRRLIGNKLTPATSLSVADAVRVDFFRKSIGSTPIVTPNPGQGPISFIFSGSVNDKKRILEFRYTYWPIDFQTTATYGLKPSSLAWLELQSGNGYIAQYPSKGNFAVIRSIYLAYYDSLTAQTYLQPVFVFEGDNGFLAYVAAVAPPWIEQ